MKAGDASGTTLQGQLGLCSSSNESKGSIEFARRFSKDRGGGTLLGETQPMSRSSGKN